MGLLVSAAWSKQADLVIISQCFLRNIADRRKFPYAVIRLVDKKYETPPSVHFKCQCYYTRIERQKER